MPNSIFIRECSETIRPADCSREINVANKEGESYLYEDLDLSFFRNITEKIYSELLLRLESMARLQLPGLHYRNVDLLNCFKLDLFGYAVDCAVAAHTLRDKIKTNPDAFLYLQDGLKDWSTPFLNQVVESLPDGLRPRIRMFAPSQGSAVQEKPRKFSVPRFWPHRLQYGLKQPTVAVFSDYQRSKSVIRLLPKHGAVYFTDSQAPKIFLNALQCGFSYFQTVAPQTTCGYENVIAEFPKTIQMAAPFQGFESEGLKFDNMLMEKLKQLTKNVLPQLLFQIDRIHQFFQAQRSIRTALLDEDISSTKNAFCQVAKQYSITTFVESHGALAGRHGYTPVTADAVFAWGKAQKETLVSWGCPDTRVIVSGCSRYRAYQVLDDLHVRKKVFKKLDFNMNIRTILLAPHPVHSERHPFAGIIQEFMQLLMGVLLDLPNIQLIIKLHPSDKCVCFYEHHCRRALAFGSVRIIKKADPFLLIKSSDFLIIHDSTMAIDGFALGRQVIHFPVFPDNEKIRHSATDIDRYQVLYAPKNMEEFKIVLDRLIADPNARPENARWKEARRECLNEGLGDSAEMIASFLKNPILLNKGIPRVSE